MRLMRADVLLDWVNTLPLDSCLLVSSVADLRNGKPQSPGAVLCDIFDLFFNGGDGRQFRSIVTEGGSPKDRLTNFQLLLSSLPTDTAIEAKIGGRRLEEAIEVAARN